MRRVRAAEVAFCRAFLRAAGDPDGYDGTIVQHRGSFFDTTDRYDIDRVQERLVEWLLTCVRPRRVHALARSAGFDVTTCEIILERLEHCGVVIAPSAGLWTTSNSPTGLRARCGR